MELHRFRFKNPIKSYIYSHFARTYHIDFYQHVTFNKLFLQNLMIYSPTIYDRFNRHQAYKFHQILCLYSLHIQVREIINFCPVCDNLTFVAHSLRLCHRISNATGHLEFLHNFRSTTLATLHSQRIIFLLQLLFR